MKHVNVLMCLDFPEGKKRAPCWKVLHNPFQDTKLHVASCARLGVTNSGVQASNALRGGRKLFTNGTGCDRLPEEEQDLDH